MVRTLKFGDGNGCHVYAIKLEAGKDSLYRVYVEGKEDSSEIIRHHEGDGALRLIHKAVKTLQIPVEHGN